MTPEIPQKEPYKVDLEAGKHFWCACGKSQNQPFCDGSHKGSDFTSTMFELKEAKTVFLCGCKNTGNAPFCDGTHSKLD